MIARFVSTRSVRLFTSLHTQEMPFYKAGYFRFQVSQFEKAATVGIGTGKLKNVCFVVTETKGTLNKLGLFT